MNPRLRFLLVLLLAGTGAVIAPARLGDTLGELKKRFGAPAPQMQPRKDQAFWLFEGDDGELMYTVTFNTQGRSIAEGLKPLKRARFGKNTAMNFVDAQLAPISDSKTTRVVKPGETYHFAGQNQVCGEREYVVVDEAHDLLIIWTQTGVPAVLVLSPEMITKLN